VNEEQAGRYVRDGWPEHCGGTMELSARRLRREA
jgi:hypothetical protein